MRNYLIDKEKNEFIVDLTRTHIRSRELIEYEFSALEENELKDAKSVFVRRLAHNYYGSFDGIKWKKIARQNLPTTMLNVDRVLDLYRGYKPSGLTAGSEGELLTQMPGKVVKISVEEGQKVEKGQTLIILEAMKMENEIKSDVSGIVKAIHVNEGDTLESGVLMLEVEKEE